MRRSCRATPRRRSWVRSVHRLHGPTWFVYPHHQAQYREAETDEAGETMNLRQPEDLGCLAPQLGHASAFVLT